MRRCQTRGAVQVTARSWNKLNVKQIAHIARANTAKRCVRNKLLAMERGSHEKTFGRCPKCEYVIVPRSKREACTFIGRLKHGKPIMCHACFASQCSRIYKAKRAILGVPVSPRRCAKPLMLGTTQLSEKIPTLVRVT